MTNLNTLPQAAPRDDASIPLRNLWVLMLWASKFWQNGKSRSDVEENPDDIPELVAQVLNHLVQERLQKKLTDEYVERQETLRRVRGRIDLLKTRRQLLLEKGTVACRYQELSIDTHRNQYVRHALEVVSKQVKNSEIRKKSQSLIKRLTFLGVNSRKPTASEISALNLGRNDRDDRSMLDAARLAFSMNIPSQESGSNNLLQAAIESRLWRIYEQAITGFYKVNLSGAKWRVTGQKQLDWPLSYASAGIGDSLQGMHPDIFIENKQTGKRIILDTKYKKILKLDTRDFSNGRFILNRDDLFQMYSYLRTQEDPREPETERTEGILLHPSAGFEYDECIEVQGHRIRFVTIDLQKSAQAIHDSLLELIESSLEKSPENTTRQE